MSSASDLGDALLERRLVAAVVIAYQLVVPAIEECAGMFTSAAAGEVIDHRAQVTELSGRICPQVRTVRLALAGAEHLHWRFVGVHHALLQNLMV
jgi:hypothetical protein